MGDMGDIFNEHNAYVRAKRSDHLHKAEILDDGKWTKHTQWHWSRTLNGKRLDYWPSRTKFQYAGRIMCGDVLGFIRNQERIGK